MKPFFLLSFLLLSKCVLAGDWSSLYDRPKREAEKPRLQKAFDYLLEHELTPYIPEGQRVGFALQPFDLPLQNATPELLALYTVNRHIELPVPTLLFVEDLAKAYAWLWTNRFGTKTIDEYLAMLRYRKPGDFAAGRYPAPLAALHIPDDALKDPRVVEMAVRTRRTAYAFMMLHQYAHLWFQQDTAGKSGRSEGQEEEADRYALGIMKGNSTTPTGILLVMNGWLVLDANNPEAEHPVTPARLEAVAHFMDGHVAEFVRGRSRQTTSIDVIHSIALLLREGAQYLSVPGHQTSVQELAMKTDVETLSPRVLPTTTR